MRQLLLIDQHPTLVRRLQTSLLFEDIEVVQVSDGNEALICYHESTLDLIVINEVFSNVVSALVTLRSIEINVPILAIITSDHSKDRVRMFHLGANDVLSQPYHIDELVVRIMNLLQLSTDQQTYGSCIEVGELLINMRNRTVSREGNEIQLTPTEYELLLFLCREAGKVQSRESILYEVWGYEFHGNTNIVDVYIRYLRIKIDKGYKKKLIRTVRGIGYMITD